MRIAICDDSQQDIADITRCLNRITEYLFEYDVFNKPDDLLKARLEKKTHYDLYIYDIEMPEMNGIELAKTIRKTDAKAQFAFLTNYTGYMKYVFEAVTLDFIEKPITEDRLKTLIFKAMDQLQQKNQSFSFSYRKGIQNLCFDEILYFEKRGRQALIHTKETIYKTNMNLTEIWHQLDDRIFTNIHTSFIVNMRNLVSSTNGEVKLRNQECLHVTKGYRKILAEKYMEMVKGGM